MTSFAGIGYLNRIDSATLSCPGSAFSGSYPLTNIQDRILANVARSANADEANTIIDIDHGSAKSDRVLWVHGHNLSASATFVVERGTTLGGTDVYQSAELAAWPSTPLNGVYNGGDFGFGLVMPSSNTARYTRLRIINSGNADGYVQISRIFLGPAFFPELGLTQLDDELNTYSTVERLEANGTDWVYKRAPLRGVSLVFGALTYEEGSVLKEIIRIHDTSSEVVYIADRNDRERMQEDSFLGLLRELGKTDYPFWRHNGIALAIDERGVAPAVASTEVAPPGGSDVECLSDTFTDTDRSIADHTPEQAPDGFVWDVYYLPNAEIVGNELDYAGAVINDGYSGGVLRHPSGDSFTIALPYKVTLVGLYTEDRTSPRVLHAGAFVDAAPTDGFGRFSVYLNSGMAGAIVYDALGNPGVTIEVPATRDVEHTVECRFIDGFMQLVVDGVAAPAEVMSDPPVTFNTIDVYLGVPGDKINGWSICATTDEII